MNKVSGVLMLLIYVFVVTAILSDNFAQTGNLQNNLRWISYYAIIGIGAAIVIITGGIELSIGSVIGLAGCALPVMIMQWHWSPALALAVAIGIALLVGLYNGLLITKVKLPPFIVTLCGLMICRGLARWLTGDQTQGFGTEYRDSMRLLALGKPCSLALLIMIFGTLSAVWFAARCFLRRQDARFQGRQSVAICAAIGSLVLAVIGSSRFWHGYQITQGRPLDVVFGWQVSTWSAAVPESAVRLPGELVWWFGLIVIPATIWFVLVALRGQRQIFMRALVSQIVAVVILLPIALRGFGEWLPIEEPWDHRWRMAEVLLSLGVIMGAIAWFLKRGLQAGGDAAKLPASVMVATGIMLLVGRSSVLQKYLADGGYHEAWQTLAGRTAFMEILVPMPFLIMLALAISISIFLNMTIYGRYLFALGRNEQAARYSGINTDAMIIVAYLLCGLATGLGAILFTLDLNLAQPSNHGDSYEMLAIAAAVVGGCSLKGGEGSILGVVLGAAVMYLLRNSISMLGLPLTLEKTIIGLVILAGVITDEMVRRVAARRRSLEAAG